MAVTWGLLMLYETGENTPTSDLDYDCGALIDKQVILILMVYRGYISYRNGGNSALFNVVYRDGKLMMNVERLRQS